ncbi:MAG: efflux RND transporter permease subunit [Rikenellaceae bacterium]
MKIYETAVRKPISTILIFIGVIVFGLYSVRTLSVDMYPEMDIPTITVFTSYVGASAEDIETNISRVLEDNLNTIDNLDKITSSSSDNISIVSLEFDWGADLDVAANDIRDAIDRVESLLPDGADNPALYRFSSSMMPIMVLYATATTSYDALYKILDDKLVNTLNRINGVGTVSMSGANEREIQVNVDPRKMEGYNLSVEQIGQIITYENVDVPAGSIDVGTQTINVRSEGEFDTAEDMHNIVVANIAGRQVYLSDVAEIKDTLKKTSVDQRIDGDLGVRIIIQKQSGANSVEIANKVKEAMPDIIKSLPPDVKIGTLVDFSESITDSINSLSETIMYAFIFVALVVLFFLGRWRATFIIVLTIPVSLIVSFIYLKVTGGSLNIISLSSLSIAIGMVVDDAIVVLENITKHIERGSSPREAAIYATNEVWLAVIATTLVVVAVFLPLTMLTGMAGIMFQSLGWIVSLVTVVSTIAAITLTPMLSSLMLRFQKGKTYKGLGILFKPIDKFLDALDNGYARSLGWVIKRRFLVLLGAVGIFVGSMYISEDVPSEFFPKSDDGQVSAVVKLDLGASVQYSMEVARKLDAIIAADFPEISTISTSTGASDGTDAWSAMQSNTGTHIINYTFRMVDQDLRDKTIFEIGDELRLEFAKHPEIVEYSVTTGSSGPNSGDADIQIKVFGYDMILADSIANVIKDSVSTIPGAADVTLSRDDLRREYRIAYDRKKLGYHGLTTSQVSMAIYNRITGYLASQFREDGDEYDIMIRFAEPFRTSIEEIENILVYNAMGQPVRISDVGTVFEEFAPPVIERENRERMVGINITLSGAAMSDVMVEVNKKLENIDIPEDINLGFGGSYEDQQESFADMAVLLLLIIVLVYIVMATQFESFSAPFIILFSLPFAFSGVFLALWISDTALSIIALIGAIMLVGIVVKNGIVMVDFINLLRERGLGLSQSVIAAGKSRLRPVLMTTLTTVLGMMPLAAGVGEGSELWQPMGIAVIGGLTFSTVLTLYVIPVVYTLFSARSLKKNKKKNARHLID